MMLLRTLEGCQPRFLMHMLNSPAIASIVRDKTGGTSSPHLNVGDIRSFPIPLPSMAEQAEIIQRVDSLFAVAKALELRIASGTSKADAICQSVLSRAFAGELVEIEAELARREGRDYEPAFVLLERVAAGRTAAENGKPKSHRKPTSCTT
jgi:type I restriction enzyme S subunit